MNLECRKAEQNDVSRAVEIHRSAICELGSEFYTDRQVEAWAAEAVPEAYPISDLSSIVLIAEGEDDIRGIGQLNVDDPEIAKLFVDPEFSGRGVGTYLLEQLERTARERDIDRLFLDASLNASDFYHHNGYGYGTMLNKHLPTGDGEVVYPTLRMWKSINE